MRYGSASNAASAWERGGSETTSRSAATAHCLTSRTRGLSPRGNPTRRVGLGITSAGVRTSKDQRDDAPPVPPTDACGMGRGPRQPGTTWTRICRPLPSVRRDGSLSRRTRTGPRRRPRGLPALYRRPPRRRARAVATANWPAPSSGAPATLNNPARRRRPALTAATVSLCRDYRLLAGPFPPTRTTRSADG